MNKNIPTAVIALSIGIALGSYLMTPDTPIIGSGIYNPSGDMQSTVQEPRYRTVGAVDRPSLMNKQAMLAHLEKLMPGVMFSQKNVVYYDAVNMYQVYIQGKMFYITGDGSAIVRGDVMDVAMLWHDPDRANLSVEYERTLAFARQQFESSKQQPDFEFADSPEKRISLLSELPSDGMVHYPSTAPLLDTLYVFFDVNCPACGRLFPEVGDLQSLGYAVNVVLIAKDGPKAKSYEQAQRILCQPDPAKSLSLFLKKGFGNFAVECKQTIDFNHNVFDRLGLSGTPYIISASTGHVFKGLHYAKDVNDTLVGQYQLHTSVID